MLAYLYHLFLDNNSESETSSISLLWKRTLPDAPKDTFSGHAVSCNDITYFYLELGALRCTYSVKVLHVFPYV